MILPYDFPLWTVYGVKNQMILRLGGEGMISKAAQLNTPLMAFAREIHR